MSTSTDPILSDPDVEDDLSKYLLASLAISPFHDDPYMKVIQAYNATSNESLILPPAPIAPLTVFETRESSHVTYLERHEEQIDAILNHLDEFPLEHIKHMEDKIEGLGSPSSRYKESSGRDPMAPKRTRTSVAPAMTQAAIRKLVADSVATALEAQAATLENIDNTNRNTGQRETPVARKCSYKEFISCQPFNFKGTEGAVGLIRWFE
nr:reverse transcriptase domain-containing protein [Tanacetum cinerariifolium]